MPFQFISIRYLCFLVGGIVLGFRWTADCKVGFLISGISILLLGLLRIRKKRNRDFYFEFLTAICLVGIGITAAGLSSVGTQKHHYSQYEHDVGILRIKIREELRSGLFNNRFIADVRAVNHRGAQGKILISTPDTISFLPDTELIVSKPWQAIRPPLNPGQFDYKKYMALQGIHDEIRLAASEFVVLFKAPATFLGRLRQLRRKIGNSLKDAGLTPSTVATTEALLLGQRRNLDTEIYDAYKNAGAVHILAVSGLHIGILVLILKFLIQPMQRFRNGDRWQYLAIITFLWAYALFTGLSPSVVRAVTLFSFIGYAWIIKRPANMYNTLALSFFFVLLVVQPAYLFQAGFQMSYAAVLAIVWIYPKLIRLWQPKPILLKRIWQILAVSLAAQLGVLPISLFYFHQFPGLFFLSNLLILPILGIVLGMGITIIFLDQVSWQTQLLFSAYDILVQAMNGIVGWIGKQEAFIFREVAFDLPCLVLAYCFLIALIRYLERRKRAFLLMSAGAVILFQSWMGFKVWEHRRTTSLYVFHAVRHSLILAREGHTIRLATEMPRDQWARMLRDYRLAKGGRVIEHIENQNAYVWKDAQILIIDRSGVYPKDAPGITHIVLTQSPKIHLERLLAEYPETHVIADGSNYLSYIRRWKQSCSRLNRSFHATGEDGAYRFR